jgi:hypothetical protein
MITRRLEVGEEVLVGDSPVIHQVTKVSPSGQITIETGLRFMPDGRWISGAPDSRFLSRLQIATPELIEQYRQREAIKKAKEYHRALVNSVVGLGWPEIDRLPDALLEKIVALLREGGVK